MAPIPVCVPLIHTLSDSTLVRLVEVALAEPDIVPPECADGVLEELGIRYYRALLKAKMSHTMATGAGMPIDGDSFD
jgi:hypothetical protein